MTYFLFSLQSNMKVAALKLSEVEQALSGSTQMTTALFDCYWLVSWATVIVYPEECGSTRSWSNAIASAHVSKCL